MQNSSYKAFITMEKMGDLSKIFKNFFLFSGALLIMASVVLAYNVLTDGFSLSEIGSDLCVEIDVKAFDTKRGVNKNLTDFFNQDFNYLGKGCQFYVFESEDKKLILKFFKHKHLRSIDWLNQFPFLGSNAQIQQLIAQRKERVERLLNSCKIAYELIPEQTGLLYAHLNRKIPLTAEVCIRDKLGIPHKLNLQEYEFILQERGIALEEVFLAISQKKERGEEYYEELNAKIEALITLITQRCQSGILDRDKAFMQNAAFALQSHRALTIDVGQLTQRAEAYSSLEIEREVTQRLQELNRWATLHFPEISEILKIKTQIAF